MLDDWRQAFLSALRNSGNVRAATQAAGIERQTAYKARGVYPDFEAQWDEAMDEAVEVLEAEARRRAMEASDVLMIFLLKAHRPAMYRERFEAQIDMNTTAPLRIEVVHIEQAPKWEPDDDDPAGSAD